ncbi:MAG: preprotein translocase subunit SecE [Porticoccaceae bacterium]|nr:preprotein translocase subunit SecE [Porticoccaceae bacterium]|tara:strand:- start:1 stop:369 length:369 start_codon:yes stop_codon:yes gene_type:complete
MSGDVQNQGHRYDWVKWALVFGLVISAIYGNWYYSAESLFFRALAFLLVLAVCSAIAFRTEKGSATWELALGAKTEWRKVIWPSKEERNQTTLIVVGVIMLMALILWGIDSLLSWVASLIMG